MKRTLNAGLALGVALGLAAALNAQEVQPRLVNARMDSRAVPSGLDRAFQGMVSSQQAPAWITYAIPAIPGEHHMCDGSRGSHYGTTYLEPRGRTTVERTTRKASLEGPADILVFFRTEAGRVQKIRVLSPDCEIDAGGLTVHLLTQVNPVESVALLSSFVRDSPRGRNEPGSNSALTALALHRDPSAGRALERFVAAGQPRDVRKHAAFWLAAGRGREGFLTLRRLLDDDDVDFRKELAFPISVSREAEAVDVLISMARQDDSPEVRRQALFWVAQKAGAKAAETIEGAIENDPDTEVKKRAVFALSQLPKDESVPRLIELARTHRNREVRKQAMFWLGQSNDPRALKFFEEVLTK